MKEVKRNFKNLKIISEQMIIGGVIILAIILGGVFLVIVNAKPKFNLENLKKIEVNSGTELKKPKTKYLFKDITNKVQIKSNVNFKQLGKYEIIYEVPILFRKFKIKQVVEVVDTLAPMITLVGEENIECSYKMGYQELGFQALDNYDGDVTSKVLVEQNVLNDTELEIIYKVSDESGNEAKRVRHVNLIDDVAPVITLKGNSNLVVFLGNKYVELGATANDEKDGDLTNNIEISGNVNVNQLGSYTISYSVSDSKGNKSVKERIVKVIRPYNSYKETNGKTIYLTFDDGPSVYTARLLDILKKYNVKATFFVTNQGLTSGHDDKIKRAYLEGHTIGLHTYSHVYKNIYQSEEAYFNDLYAIQKKVKDITGYESTIMRFPGGSSNTISKFNPGIMSRLVNEVEFRGFRYFDWNVSSGDAGGAKTSTEVFNNVVRSLKNGKTYVVLQHDIKGFSVDAVEAIIEYGLANGYTFAPLTMESPVVHHGVNN